MLKWIWMTMAALMLATAAGAQDRVWIQIEAHPNTSQANAAAKRYSAQLQPLEGYRLRSGWYALAIGPLSQSEAPTVLRQLRITRQIPGDSYLTDGTNFGAQFWPAAGSAPQTAPTVEVAPPPPPPPAPKPGEETPAEARKSESLLSRDERKDIQVALAWQGFYTSTIDGAFGRGTRASMAAWQTANGFLDTGVLTTLQRYKLLKSYKDVLSSIGLDLVNNPVAGVSVEMPLAMVEFDRYEPPFAHYKSKSDDGVELLLISQQGDAGTMEALYEVMQTLEIVPLEGERSVRRNSFILNGANSEITTFATASAADGAVKGYVLIWPTAKLDKRRDLVLSRMKSSFEAVSGTVLPDQFGKPLEQSLDLMAGLKIRRPDISRSGFYVSRDGAILTSADAVASCGRVTVGPDQEAEIVATDKARGLAVIRPTAATRPLGAAIFSDRTPRIGAEIAVSGYSFGGRLGAPSLTFGTFAEPKGLNAETDLHRLAVSLSPSDAGGPVIDSSGTVVGLVLPREVQNGRVLPEDVQLIAAPARMTAFLSELDIEPVTPSAPKTYAAEKLAGLASDMTVLVNCWN